MDNRGSISWKTSSPVESKGFRSTNLCFLFVLFFFFALVAIPVPALPNSGNQESHHAHRKKLQRNTTQKLPNLGNSARHHTKSKKVATQPHNNPGKSPHKTSDSHHSKIPESHHTESHHTETPEKKAARILTSFAIVAWVLSALFVCK